MIRTASFLMLALCAAAVLAKLPPPSDEAKAKAAEAAAKTAHGDKLATFQLCNAQNRVALQYQANAAKAGKPPLAAAPGASAPVIPPCTDPGPFVYAAAGAASAGTPGAGPLEAAGAHSPAKTAATPPNSNAPASPQGPAKK